MSAAPHSAGSRRSKTFGGGVIGDMVGKHVVGEAKVRFPLSIRVLLSVPSWGAGVANVRTIY